MQYPEENGYYPSDIEYCYRVLFLSCVRLSKNRRKNLANVSNTIIMKKKSKTAKAFLEHVRFLPKDAAGLY